MNDQSTVKVFVYGTLREGQRNHIMVEASPCRGLAYTKGLLFDLGSFPGLKKGNGTVYGEVYEVTRGVLSVLDRLEGHPHFYRREPIEVTILDDEGVEVESAEALAYFYQGEIKPKMYIESGDWLDNGKESEDVGARLGGWG